MLGVSLGLWIVIALLTIITFLLFLITSELQDFQKNLRMINGTITDCKREISLTNVSNNLYAFVKDINKNVEEIRRFRY